MAEHYEASTGTGTDLIHACDHAGPRTAVRQRIVRGTRPTTALNTAANFSTGKTLGIIDAAQEHRSIVVTSNIHPSGFDTITPKSLAGASTDGLIHQAHLVTTTGDSYGFDEALAGSEWAP
ncbi:ATP-binding protein [Streptomyces spinosirectus]